MDRIAIVGCGGSGKSRLARVLGARLSITPIHLDTLYYDKDWKPLNQETFASLQRELVTAPRWIIDGNYASTLPIRLEAADTVIFLDLTGWACLRGIAARRLRHGGGQHQAIGVYDRVTWGFIRYVLGYRKQMAPRVRALIVSHAGDAQVSVLRSRAAVRRYLAGQVAAAPALTEIDGVIQAGGVKAATFAAPASGILDELTTTVDRYVNEACHVLAELWLNRRASPALLAQSPKQWKQPEGLIVPPAFRGFPHLVTPPSLTTSFGVSTEGERRLRAAALRPDLNDIKPDPGVWS